MTSPPCQTAAAGARVETPRRVTATVPDAAGLGAIDDLLAAYARQREAQAAHTRAVLLEFHRFDHAAACRFEQVVEPALQNIARRLSRDGGGGLVVERAAAGRHGQRITLWISLEGPVASPRNDLYPYLQLDVDVPGRRIEVWEGDMWDKLGSSRRTEPFTLEELTTEAVTQRAIAILRRTVSRGSPLERGETS